MSKDVYATGNPPIPEHPIVIDPEKCDGCKNMREPMCIISCRSECFMPNPEKGKPPILIYPEECWYGGCCVGHCPRGAITFQHPITQRARWKRKTTGEYFRIGMK